MSINVDEPALPSFPPSSTIPRGRWTDASERPTWRPEDGQKSEKPLRVRQSETVPDVTVSSTGAASGPPVVREVSATATVAHPSIPKWPQPRPDVIYPERASVLMSDVMYRVIDRVINQLLLTARREFVQTEKFRIYEFCDKDEGVEQVVLRQYVKLSPRAAIRYRRQAMSAVERLLPTLSALDRRIARERLAVEVRGTGGHESV